MNRQIRRRKEMAVRVRDFSHAHPSADPSFASILGRLEEGINRLTLVHRLGEDDSSHREIDSLREGRRRRNELDLVFADAELDRLEDVDREGSVVIGDALR